MLTVTISHAPPVTTEVEMYRALCEEGLMIHKHSLFSIQFFFTLTFLYLWSPLSDAYNARIVHFCTMLICEYPYGNVRLLWCCCMVMCSLYHIWDTPPLFTTWYDHVYICALMIIDKHWCLCLCITKRESLGCLHTPRLSVS